MKRYCLAIGIASMWYSSMVHTGNLFVEDNLRAEYDALWQKYKNIGCIVREYQVGQNGVSLAVKTSCIRTEAHALLADVADLERRIRITSDSSISADKIKQLKGWLQEYAEYPKDFEDEDLAGSHL